jgi:HEAT repeat protein
LQQGKSVITQAYLVARLGGGDRRSIGDAAAVAQEACSDADVLVHLWECLRSTDGLVRMRAADALEKVSRARPDLLMPWRDELLSGSFEDGTSEVTWNLLAILPRLNLSERQAKALMVRLTGTLYEDRSRIVRTVSLEAVANLCIVHAGLREDAARLLTASLSDPTPSLRARARRLLARRDVRRALAEPK